MHLGAEKRGQLVWGGVYKLNSDVIPDADAYTAGRYEWWIPLYDDTIGEVVMVNTYDVHFDKSDAQWDRGKREEVFIRRYMGRLYRDGYSFSREAPSGSFNKLGYIIITDDTIGAFKLVADLNGYEYVEPFDVEFYAPGDVLQHVSLWRDHDKHNRGVNFVRKGAEKTPGPTLIKAAEKVLVYESSWDMMSMAAYDLKDKMKGVDVKKLEPYVLWKVQYALDLFRFCNEREKDRRALHARWEQQMPERWNTLM